MAKKSYYRNPSNLITINGQPLPCPAPGLEIISTINVDAGRNANGTVIGQVIGRRMWKLNNLQWNGISVEEWARIKALFGDFFVKVTFTGDDNKRHSITMYPGDMNATPISVTGLNYDGFKTAKFNLIDCGKSGES